ncbi:MAG: crossover junction endodeoxyribonuclease RuvC [Planctomycetota bacterium]|nr:crossover junction endodeoxyribonuclease RuvC [Planctomycetota bacterium]MDA1213974.1 crossover junction endodeoxyribonuclease RuvC [Planctomycetota bacterium]
MTTAEPLTRDLDITMGIDPGLNCTGYAVLQKGTGGPKLCEGGVIRSTRQQSLASRVHEITVGFREILEQYRPRSLAIEQVFVTPQFPKSALLMAHVRGSILMTAIDFQMTVTHYPATQIKRMLTGSGRASKSQMQHAVQRELQLPALPEPHDLADALAIALCHYYSVRFVATRAS